MPPAIAARACEALEGIPLPEGTVLALEKPFGVDEASARALNATLLKLVPENQVFRVDHFLGSSTVLNLLGVRFANRVLEAVWSAENIESVVIRYDEMLALEGRAGYYDRAGALVDMIQSHLLQVLAFVAMEPPASLDEVDLRAATSAALRATALWEDDPVRSSRRAVYTAGTVDGEGRAVVRRRGRRRPAPAHRDARRAHVRSAHRALEGRAVHACARARRSPRATRRSWCASGPCAMFRPASPARLPARCCASPSDPTACRSSST